MGSDKIEDVDNVFLREMREYVGEHLVASSIVGWDEAVDDDIRRNVVVFEGGDRVNPPLLKDVGGDHAYGEFVRGVVDVIFAAEQRQTFSDN